MLEYAIDLWKRGFNIIPIVQGTKKPAVPWKKYQMQRVTEEEIQDWWGSSKNWGVAVVTGGISGVFVLDEDVSGRLEERGLVVPGTLSVKTPSGGRHYYFKYPRDAAVRNRVGIIDGVDIRGDGGYVVAPPTVGYAWLTPDAPVADPPRWLLELLAENGAEAVHNDEWYTELLKGVPAGERDNAAIRLAGRWARRGLSADEIAGLLYVWNTRNRPPMGELPGDPPVEKWIRDKVKSAIRMEEERRARTPDPEEVLKGLESAASNEQKIAALRKLPAALAGRPPEEREYYEELARKKAGNLSKTALRKILQYASNGGSADNSVPTPLAEPRRPKVALAQDYYDGVFHYGIWLPTTPDAVLDDDFVFKLVRSDRTLADPLEGLTMPMDTRRWSVDAKTPYNVFEWLEGRDDLDVAALFEELKSVFDEYMWYPRQNTGIVLALWAMSTYVFMCFDSTSYIVMTGTKHSGKSRTLELLEQLCFNALPANSTTTPGIFRSVALNQSTVLLDESDVLSLSPAVAQGGIDERLSILLSGYRRGKLALRVEGDGLVPRGYDSYSPKAFASMHKIQDALVDRAIVIKVGRRPPNVAVGDLVMREQSERFQILRNKLYFFGLSYAETLVDEQHLTIDLLRQRGITDRECEIWLVPATIARTIGGTELFDEVVKQAVFSACDKRDQEQNSYTAAVLWACWSLLTRTGDDVPPPARVDECGEWYLRKHIRELIAQYMDIDVQKVSAERVGRELIATGVIEGSSKYRRQLWNKKYRGERAYLLKKERVMDAAQRYGLEECSGIWEA